MASKMSKPSFLRSIAKRSYGAQAAPQPVSLYNLPKGELQTSSGITLRNFVISSIETNSPISKVAIIFRAGSRFESSANAGVSHAIRRAVGFDTVNRSRFGLIRNMQQSAASISIDGGREHIAYSMEISRDEVHVALDLLREVSTQQTLKLFQMRWLQEYLDLDLALKDTSVLVIENLHSAAFRTGLGNSLYAPSHRTNKFQAEELDKFLAETHGTLGTAIVGLGVKHDDLEKFAESLPLNLTKATSDPTRYMGGEIRVENGSDLAYVVVCGEGASINSNDTAALAVAKYALGAGSTVKYGNNLSGKLSQSIEGKRASVSGFNASYSDGGLFGYMVVAEAGDAGQIVKSVHSTVKNINLSEAEVSAAKNQLKCALLMSAETSSGVIEEVGLQTLLTGKYVSAEDAVNLLDNITANTVNSAINRAFSGKITMSAVGGLHTVPYLDQI